MKDTDATDDARDDDAPNGRNTISHLPKRLWEADSAADALEEWRADAQGEQA